MYIYTPRSLFRIRLAPLHDPKNAAFAYRYYDLLGQRVCASLGSWLTCDPPCEEGYIIIIEFEAVEMAPKTGQDAVRSTMICGLVWWQSVNAALWCGLLLPA